MKILDIYIGKVVIVGAILALTVLVSIDVFFGMIGELEDVGQGSFTYQDVFHYILLTLPARIYNLFPAAVLVGGLMSLGTLASHSELVAMRAAGISVNRIVRAAAQAGIVLMLLVVLIGEFVLPPAQRQAQSVESKKKGVQISSSLGSLWLRIGSDYINVNKAYPDFRLENVKIHRFNDDATLHSSTSAAAVFYQDQQWELHDIERTTFAGGDIKTENKEVEYWPGLLDPQLLEVLTIEPEMMSAYELNRYIMYLKKNKLQSAKYRLAFWLKMTTPVSCIVMLLIIMPFVFGSLRSVNAGQLMVVGILLGLAFYILIQIASRAGQVYGVPPFISATLPVLCFTVAGLVGLTRIR